VIFNKNTQEILKGFAKPVPVTGVTELYLNHPCDCGKKIKTLLTGEYSIANCEKCGAYYQIKLTANIKRLSEK